MTKEEIKSIIPHREPMLLLDSAQSMDAMTAQGSYTVRGDEWFLQGHFPGNPVVPGVILCEMMAQTCCVLMVSNAGKSTPYFTGLNNVKFRNKVLPGDQIIFDCELIKIKHPFYFAKGTGKVGDKIAVSGEFSFALAD